jgi:hypothetical protein
MTVSTYYNSSATYVLRIVRGPWEDEGMTKLSEMQTYCQGHTTVIVNVDCQVLDVPSVHAVCVWGGSEHAIGSGHG